MYGCLRFLCVLIRHMFRFYIFGFRSDLYAIKQDTMPRSFVVVVVVVVVAVVVVSLD